MTKIGFDPKTLGTITANEEGADVCDAAGDNALPLVVGQAAAAYAGVKVVALADVQRRKLAGADLPTEDVDAATVAERHADRVQLKVVRGSAPAKPRDGRDGLGGWSGLAPEEVTR